MIYPSKTERVVENDNQEMYGKKKMSSVPSSGHLPMA